MYDMLDPSKRLKQRFMDGGFEFVSTTMDQPSYIEDEGIRCSCVRCICQKNFKSSYVRAHLLQYGFQPNYHVWFIMEKICQLMIVYVMHSPIMKT